MNSLKMVCKDCEKKQVGIHHSDPFASKARNVHSDASGSGGSTSRKVGGNMLLTKKGRDRCVCALMFRKGSKARAPGPFVFASSSLPNIMLSAILDQPLLFPTLLVGCCLGAATTRTRLRARFVSKAFIKVVSTAWSALTTKACALCVVRW